jgi:hypothetical protein
MDHGNLLTAGGSVKRVIAGLIENLLDVKKKTRPDPKVFWS